MSLLNRPTAIYLARIPPTHTESQLTATGIYIAYTKGSYTGIAINPSALSILGVALSVFLGFRANTSFQRWSEAAQAWAMLVTTGRTLARVTVTFIDAKSASPTFNTERATEFKRRALLRIAAFLHSLRLQ